MTAPTELETMVLLRIRRGVDPWGDSSSSSRRVSQALGRLKREGLIWEMSEGADNRYALTSAGWEVAEARR